jgi:chromate transporter
MSEPSTAAPPLANQPSMWRRLLEVARVFLHLGCVSFGGPVAHLAHLRAEFVGRRGWLDDAEYADLVALCQCLPGPASSQVVFALGMRRAGWVGALVASACFTVPSAVLMGAFAYGAARVPDINRAGWLHGLKLAAVAVVAQAVWGMGKTLCPDRARRSLCIASAAFLLSFPSVFAQLGAIALGAGIGFGLYRDTLLVEARAHEGGGMRGHRAAALALVTYAALLVALPALAATTGWGALAKFDVFYRAGALVFGGGHVVLPLLRAEVVPRGWITDGHFLAGYAAAQALPGPLFAFAAYLGAAMDGGAPNGWTGVWCLLAIFLPAWLLIGGALPFWHRLRSTRWAQAALAGANASVVGVLLAALYTPVFRGSVRGGSDVAAVVVAFGLLEIWKVPSWRVVVGLAVAGQWVLSA